MLPDVQLVTPPGILDETYTTNYMPSLIWPICSIVKTLRHPQSWKYRGPSHGHSPNDK